MYIVYGLVIHSLGPSPFLKGGSKFRLPPPKGGIWKIKKGGLKYGTRAGLLKRGADTYYIFCFTLCKIVLCIWKKNKNFCHHDFMKKGLSKLSKNESENVP